MVTSQIALLGRQLANGISQDIAAFFARFNQNSAISPGLHTYHLPSDNGNRRLHLRIEADGRGVLLVDVTDVIHLNATAIEIAKMALDGYPQHWAGAHMSARYSGVDRWEIEAEVSQIYDLISNLIEPKTDCPTCDVSTLDYAPLFSIKTSAPYKADLALTYGCNNQCAHCYNEPDRFQMPSLALGQWCKVLDILHGVGIPHIIFTGGEATLHPNLQDIIHYADSLGMITGLNTNGRRLARPDYAAQLYGAGLNHVQVTLGSHREALHNEIMGARAFQQTVNGIKNALSAGLHCITNTTLMRCNMDDIEKTIDFIHDLGVQTFAMNGMIYSGGGRADPNAIPEEEMPPLLVRVRDHAAAKKMRFLWYTPTEYCRLSPVELEIGAKRCNAAEYSICIEPNGDVLPCQSFYTSAGNILADSWQEIWHGELFFSFRDRENHPQFAGLPEKCWSCPDLPLCGGGCRIERESRLHSQNGNPDEAYRSCGSCGTGLSNTKSDTSSSFVPTNSITRTAMRSSGKRNGSIQVIESRDQSQ